MESLNFVTGTLLCTGLLTVVLSVYCTAVFTVVTKLLELVFGR